MQVYRPQIKVFYVSVIYIFLFDQMIIMTFEVFKIILGYCSAMTSYTVGIWFIVQHVLFELKHILASEYIFYAGFVDIAKYLLSITTRFEITVGIYLEIGPGHCTEVLVLLEKFKFGFWIHLITLTTLASI